MSNSIEHFAISLIIINLTSYFVQTGRSNKKEQSGKHFIPSGKREL